MNANLGEGAIARVAAAAARHEAAGAGAGAGAGLPRLTRADFERLRDMLADDRDKDRIPHNVLSDLEAHILEFENPDYIITARRAIAAGRHVTGRADLALFIERWIANDDERRRQQGRGGGRGGRGRGGKRRTVKKSKRSRRKSRNKRRH